MINSIPFKPLAKKSLVASALSLSLLLSACSEQSVTKENIAPVIRPVFTEVVSSSTTSDLYFNGTVQSASQAELSFRVGGQLIELNVNEGSVVNKGDIIAKLDDADAKIALASAQNELDNARVEFNRAKTLFETQKSISQSQLDELTLKFKLAKNRLSEAQQRLSDTSIKAPFSGMISRRFVNNHVAVQANDKIVSLHDLNNMEVVINVPDTLMTGGKKKPVIKATSSLIPGVTYDLSVKNFATEPDPVTRTYAITLSFNDLKDTLILPGMSVRVSSDAQADGDFITVPLSAISPDNLESQYVWVVNADNKVEKRIVKTGSLHGDRIQVITSLKQGEQIVVAGILSLTEGMEVRPTVAEAK